MKSLWIVNKCCGALHQKRYGKKATGGQWLDAMLEQAAQFPEDRIIVVNIEKKPVLEYFHKGNVSFYTLPGEPNEKYDYSSREAVNAWKKIIDQEQPDIIEIWGTEFPYSLAAMDVAPEIPAVIYVQGILDSIAKYYLSGLDNRQLRQARTLRDIMTGSTIRQTQKQYERRGRYEKEIARRAGHVIIENHWAEAYYQKMCPEVKAHFLPISISACFRNHKWNETDMAPHTIMCPAADYPIKGLHMLLKAMALVKRQYPDVKLYIPGTPLREIKTFQDKLKQTGYARLLRIMIQELGLGENNVFTGRLTADEMAQKMSEVNCFVMTSAIENHSSTLKEAMTVGVPCVASSVGGVPEYAKNGENCLLYRFEDYEMLAYDIQRIFEDPLLRNVLSKNARADMKRSETEVSDYAKMRDIYGIIISQSDI